ncbi:hypothetical protein [Xenorhabdus bovienii]|uniref:hypothetical protein n=1 Tax=Xenorhabdus bovienii TaxID=40576 RepID=UPI0023B2E8A1|nr:hypothetical protein [Xenorhabdus bovienii]MDE9447975.1 hypothetical protein [Xenorhabdus bovienii]MDE9537195.1 hypothetical protein [Xenorhabdus bovienii]MDE9589840.1 hypothetical protein [Xenorhabdus bovienii]
MRQNPYNLFSEKEWKKLLTTRLNPAINQLLIRHETLQNGFNESGSQTASVQAVITGNLEGLTNLLNETNWRYEQVHNDVCAYLFNLLAET